MSQSRKGRRSAVRPTQQARSVATQHALVAALRRLLGERPFQQIAVRDVVSEAGCSIGAFYARFASREALLLPLIRELVDEALALVAQATEPRDSLREQVAAYVDAMVQWMARNRRLLSAVQGAGAAAVPELAAEARRFNETTHALARRAVLAHRAEIRAGEPEHAVEYGLFIASAAAREGAVSQNWASYRLTPSPDGLARSITDAWHAYLTTAPPVSTRPPRRARRV